MVAVAVVLVLLLAGCGLGGVRSDGVPTADTPFTLTALDVGQSTFPFRCIGQRREHARNLARSYPAGLARLHAGDHGGRGMDGPCPGCGVVLPTVSTSPHRYVNASAACWAAYGVVLAAEYSDPLIFGGCHELSVDAYIAQHPGGDHPTRSVVVHLAGLHLALVRGVAPADIPTARARLAKQDWAGPDPVIPARWGPMTVRDLVAVAGTPEHVAQARAFAAEVWAAWAHEHDRVAAFVGDADA